MLGHFEGLLLSIVTISIVWIFLLVRKGPVAALAAGMVLSFAFPVWVRIDLGGLPLGIRTAIACITLLGFAFHPKSRIISPLTLLDFCVALMFAIHVAADGFATGFTLGLPFRAYGEWALPYVAGRYAIRTRNDLKTIAPWIAGVLTVVSLCACIEALTKVNLIEVIFGNRPTELANRNAQRFGFKRAFGPTMHPIYFGMLIAVFTPWLVCLWQSCGSTDARKGAIVMATITFLGAFATLSRTPVMTILVAAVLTLGLRYRPIRWPLGILLSLAVAAFAIFPNQFTDIVSRVTGGGDKLRIVEIDGKATVVSSSRSRLLIFSVYRDALVKAGPLGYGSNAVSKFPPDIPYLQGTANLDALMGIVDNGYALITLRFGWLGCACLIILFLISIATGFSLHSDRPDQLLPGTVACLLFVIAVASLFMVHMVYDFGMPILWTIGILSGLASARIEQRSMNRMSLR